LSTLTLFPVVLGRVVVCCSFEAAEADCNAVLAFPQLGVADQVKALLRRGTARIHKNELDGAQADFKQVLQLEPNNRQAREELKVTTV
jgi:Tfp pilus assembly protein PilF